MPINRRSRNITEGIERAPNRSMYYALGYQEGRDVVLEFHLASGSERLAALAQAIAAGNGTDLVLADSFYLAFAAPESQ